MRLLLSSDPAEMRTTMTPMVKAIVRAHKWKEGVLAGDRSGRILVDNRFDVRGEYLRRVLGCAFLAPDILEAILDGNHPVDLTVKQLSRRRLPIDWVQQRIELGFPSVRA